MPDPLSSSRVVVAELLRPRGNRGELLAVSQTDVPNRLQTLQACFVKLNDGSEVPVMIESAWQHGDLWVLKFEGVETISAAERFRSSDLCVPASERGSLPDGELFRTDLLGCLLVDGHTGSELGVIEGFQQFGGPLLLETTVGGRECLVPFIPEFCPDVDLERRRISLNLPPGLLEL